MPEVHVFMISILKTLLLGFTWYGKQFRGTGLNKHCKYLLLHLLLKLLEWSV
jgi:hypothetical protein